MIIYPTCFQRSEVHNYYRIYFKINFHASSPLLFSTFYFWEVTKSIFFLLNFETNLPHPNTEILVTDTLVKFRSSERCQWVLTPVFSSINFIPEREMLTQILCLCCPWDRPAAAIPWWGWENKNNSVKNVYMKEQMVLLWTL